MISTASLVAVLITLSCVARTLEDTGTFLQQGQDTQRGYLSVRRVPNKIATQQTPILLRVDRVEKKKMDKGHTVNTASPVAKDNEETRERPRRRKRKMDRTMAALLMAYKMKFVALIPTLIGGLILLKATTLLAGFFFALFAAVLGLKIHR